MDIRFAQSEEQGALTDFLVSVNGEDGKNLASDYVRCMFSNDYRRPFFVVAVDGKNIIGAAAFSAELFSTDIWGISWVSVDNDHRNMGIGQRLVERCLLEIERKAGKKVTVILNTYPGKTGLYDRTGFQQAGYDHHGGSLMTKIVGA